MADTVDVITLYNNPQKLAVLLLSRSDGTGESNVVKVDKSTLTGLDGTEPTGLVIEKIEYDVSGMEVLLSYDHTTDLRAIRLQSGFGCFDFTDVGGLYRTGSGDTGDLLLSTNGHSAGDSYAIKLVLRKKD